MVRFNVTKNLEGYRVTLDNVAMAAKWTLDWTYCREGQWTATCEETLKLVHGA
jgi:hypothetical protein